MADHNGNIKSGPAIIVKKVDKGGHGGHHGGAWKIAYADFVTAMMAFFLLLWLLNSVTQEQLQGISNYFAPASISQSNSGAGGILGGKTITAPGSAVNSTSTDSVTVNLPTPKAGSGGNNNQQPQTPNDNAKPSDKAIEKRLRQKEQQQFEQAKKELKTTLAGIPAMKNLADSLLIDNTPEGLRIQLVDKQGLAMFPSGSADMYLHTKKLLALVAKIIAKLPQNISISGHTDAAKFQGGNDYTNWELSADRANAARRELVHLGIPVSRIQRVVGKAATDPLLPNDPKNPRNRRISIVLLRGTGKNNPANEGKPMTPEALPGLNAIKRRQLEQLGTLTPVGPNSTNASGATTSTPSTSSSATPPSTSSSAPSSSAPSSSTPSSSTPSASEPSTSVTLSPPTPALAAPASSAPGTSSSSSSSSTSTSTPSSSGGGGIQLKLQPQISP